MTFTLRHVRSQDRVLNWEATCSDTGLNRITLVPVLKIKCKGAKKKQGMNALRAMTAPMPWKCRWQRVVRLWVQSDYEPQYGRYSKPSGLFPSFLKNKDTLIDPGRKMRSGWTPVPILPLGCTSTHNGLVWVPVGVVCSDALQWHLEFLVRDHCQHKMQVMIVFLDLMLTSWAGT